MINYFESMIVTLFLHNAHHCHCLSQFTDGQQSTEQATSTAL